MKSLHDVDEETASQRERFTFSCLQIETGSGHLSGRAGAPVASENHALATDGLRRSATVLNDKPVPSEKRSRSCGRNWRPLADSREQWTSFEDVTWKALCARHDTLEYRQIQQEGAMDDLRAHVVELEKRIARGASATPTDSMTAEAETTSEVGHHLCANVWDSALIVGLPDAGLLGSLSMMGAFLVNLVLQFLLCLVVYADFTDNSSFPSLDEVQRWRYSTAHEVTWADSVTGSSLASRVCNGDKALAVSSGQGTLIDEIGKYAGGLDTWFLVLDVPQGALLCGVAVVVWYLIVMMEAQDAVHFMFGVFVSWKRGRQTGAQSSNVRQDSDGAKFMEVGSARLSAMVAVVALRLSVCVLLFFVGQQWLLDTTSVEDIILNAAALSFILEVDECVFQTMVTRKAKAMLGGLQPLPRLVMSRFRIGGNSITFPLAVWLCLVVLLGSLVPSLTQNVENMTALSTQMCGGNLDFVVAFVQPAGYVVLSKSEPFLDQFTLDFESLALQEAVWIDDVSNVTFSWVSPSTFWFDFGSTLSMDEFADTAVSCADFVEHSSFTRNLAFKLGLSDSWTCADAKQYCSGSNNSLLRYVCPSTCGCRSPQSDLFIQSGMLGCPVTSCSGDENYKALYFDLPCESPSVEELLENPQWVDFLESMNFFINDIGGDMGLVASTLAERGCSALVSSVKPILCQGNTFWAPLSMWCPVECGCRVPLPSNTEGYYDNLCPARCDIWRRRHVQSLETAACIDGTAADFRSNATTVALLELHRSIYGTFSMSDGYLPYVSLQSDGCQGLNLTWCGTPWTLRLLCPVLCGCLETPDQIGCPSSC